MVRWQNERGIALVLSLLLMLAASVLAASLAFMSQTETYSSANYRLMSQARYGAEAGVNRAVNYLVYTYTTPGGAGDPLAAYNLTTSPVTYLGNPVVLSGNPAVASNYPVAAVQAAFAAAAAGSVAAGSATVQFAPYATLTAMRQINVYGGGTAVVQTWQITSDATIAWTRPATVEVTATLEQEAVPTQLYAAFATAGNCGALSFTGGSTTDSYDSSALVAGNPAITASGGNVGTNGNLTASGGATINGTLSTPRVGVGSCSSGNVDAVSSSGGATITGGVVRLPAQVQVPSPPVPVGVPTTSVTIHTTTTYGPGSYGDITVNGGATLHLTAGTINMNSLSLSGGASLVIDSGPVILNIVGAGQSTPLDFTGGSVANLTGWDPATFQILYAGSGNIKLTGGANAVMMVDAPNAPVTITGGAHFYGSIIAQTVPFTGGAQIHYDRHLSSEFFMTGNQMLTSFGWNKY
jgi:hypothetical protein